MSKPQIRILIVEDDKVDRMACRRSLADENHDYEFVLYEAETGREGLQLAHAQKPDCVLLDYHLPDLNGLDFLVELKNDLGEIPVPVIMLTGTDNVTVAVEALRRGAQDYMIKDSKLQYLELLPAVIERVLRERRTLMKKKQMESLLVQAEAKFRFLVEHIPAITYTAALDIPGKLSYVSPQLSALGYSPEEWAAQVGSLRSHIHPDDLKRAVDAFDHVRTTGKPLRCEYRLFNRAGEVRWFLDEASLVHDKSGEPLFLQGILIDITEDKRAEEELRYLSAQLLTIQENERKRIATDLHDGLGQSLNMIKFGLAEAEKLLAAGATSEASESLQRLKPKVNGVLDEVRHVAMDLRPPMLDDIGILATLSWFFRELEATCPSMKVEKDIGIHESNVPDSLKITIFRIIQEATSNIVKYANADLVRMSLKKDGDALHFTIEDNGVGFDPAGVAIRSGSDRGLGMLSMKERASLSGGAYVMHSAAGKGTRIQVSWQFDNVADEGNSGALR